MRALCLVTLLHLSWEAAWGREGNLEAVAESLVAVLLDLEQRGGLEPGRGVGREGGCYKGRTREDEGGSEREGRERQRLSDYLFVALTDVMELRAALVQLDGQPLLVRFSGPQLRDHLLEAVPA